MIKSFNHKGLQLFFEEGSTKLINNEHKERICVLLLFLNTLDSKQTLLKHPKYRHELKGFYKGKFSMSISGNWRLIFDFDGENVYLLDYLDYH